MRSALRSPAEFSAALVFLYVLSILLPSTFTDPLPRGSSPAQKTSAQASGYGPTGNLDWEGEAWNDDEPDACHSSPVNHTPDDAAPFALVDSESMARKGGPDAPGLPARFLRSDAVSAGPPRCLSRNLRSFTGPPLPFPARLPAFLISALPPPLPA